MNRVYQALVAEIVRQGENISALDVGCGPGTYLHLLPASVKPRYALDAFAPYLEKADATVRMLGKAEDLLPTIDSRSIDLVYALDFIEHLEKEPALYVLAEMTRIAAKAAVVFTPYGFQEQHGDVRGEGADHWQTHRSGWLPEEFAVRGFDVDVWPDFDYGKGAGGERAIWAVWRS